MILVEDKEPHPRKSLVQKLISLRLNPESRLQHLVMVIRNIQFRTVLVRSGSWFNLIDIKLDVNLDPDFWSRITTEPPHLCPPGFNLIEINSLGRAVVFCGLDCEYQYVRLS